MTSILRILPAAAVALALGAGAAAAQERTTGVVQSVDRASQIVTLNGGATFDINGATSSARDIRPGQMVTVLPNGRTHLHTIR